MKTVIKLSFGILLSVIVFSCAKKDTVTPKKDPDPKQKSDMLTVTAISPDYGKAGAEITIMGTGFSATVSADIVTIDGKTATVKTATTTQLTVTAPVDASHGAVTVKVGSTSVAGPTFYYEPVITSISASTGKAGDIITITGKNFGTTAADFEVKFNGVVAEITEATLTSLKVKVPATATNGAISVARKTKTAVAGPAFSVTTGGSMPGGFTVTDGKIDFTHLLKNGVYSSILCFTVDEAHNVMYVGTVTHIVKIDLITNAVTPLAKNSDFIKLGGSQPSAIDVSPDGKLYVLTDIVSVFGVPTTGGNLYNINTTSGAAALVGERYIGLNIGGALGDSIPFMVTKDGEFITIDGGINNVVKYSSDLKVRTVIKPAAILEDFSHLLRNADNSIRIVTQTLFNKSYYDYANNKLSAKKDYPAAINTDLISLTRGGSSFYGIKVKPAADAATNVGHAQYTIGKTNSGQTAFEKTASFTIDSYLDGAIKTYDFIGLLGKSYFYADKNDNMYALVTSFAFNDNSGIVKFKIN